MSDNCLPEPQTVVPPNPQLLPDDWGLTVQAFADRLAEGLFVYSALGIEYLNPAMCSILGVPEGDCNGPTLRWKRFVMPETGISTRDLLQRVLAGEETTLEHTGWFHTRHLGPRFFSLVITRLDTDPPRVVTLVHDITEREANRQSLRRRSELLQGIAEATHLMISYDVREPQVLASIETVRQAAQADRVIIAVTEGPSLTEASSLSFRTRGQPVGSASSELPMRWRRILSSHKPIHARVEDLPPDERAIFESEGVQAVLSVPIIVDKVPRGHLRFDRLDSPALWSPDEVAALQTVANSYGSALAHSEALSGLRESEERYRRLVENAPNFIYRMSLPDGRYEYASPAATEMVGYTPEEILTRPMLIREALHPGWQGYFETEWAKLLRGEYSPTFEYATIHGQTGDTRWLYQTNVLVHNKKGEVIAIEGIVSDITARKKAELQLRTQQSILESIFRAAPVGIGLLSDRVILQVNDKVCEMTGYTQDELIGSNIRRLYPTEIDYELSGSETYSQIRRAGTASVETRWQHKDGSKIDIILGSTPLDDHNLAAGITFTALDITDRNGSA